MLRCRHTILLIALTWGLLGCERVPPSPPSDSTAYEAQYYLWRGSAEQQLDDLESWILGDHELRRPVAAQTDDRHIRFLHTQIQQDMVCAALLVETQLGSDELREALKHSSSPAQDQVLWVKWFGEHDPDGISRPVVKSPTNRSIISRINEGKAKYQRSKKAEVIRLE